MPVYPQQDNINLGSGATVEDREEAYANQGATAFVTTTSATLDLGAGTSWILGDSGNDPIFTVTEDSGGDGNSVIFGSKTVQSLDNFDIRGTGEINILMATNDANTYTSVLSGNNTGAGSHILQVKADNLQLGDLNDILGFFADVGTVRQTITGVRDSNAALANLLTALDGHGLIIDSTTAT